MNTSQYIGMRNEQAACYAAQAMGYLTGDIIQCSGTKRSIYYRPSVLHLLKRMYHVRLNRRSTDLR